MKIEYPKYLYHATEAAQVVQSKEEHEALGEGWQESPVMAEEPKEIKPEKKSKKKGEQPEA